MRTLGQKIANVLDNPFFLSEILAVAIDNFTGGRKASIIDAYLIIPLIMRKETRDIFKKTNASGTLPSLFESKNMIYLLGLEEEVKFYKEKVNKALIIGCNNNMISFNNKKFELLSEKPMKKINIDTKSDYVKSAARIGKIFSKNRLQDILNFMEVKRI